MQRRVLIQLMVLWMDHWLLVFTGEPSETGFLMGGAGFGPSTVWLCSMTPGSCLRMMLLEVFGALCAREEIRNLATTRHGRYFV